MSSAADLYTTDVKDPSVFTTERKKGGAYKLGADGAQALAALTAESTVKDALAVLSQVVKDGHPGGPGVIGKATIIYHN